MAKTARLTGTPTFDIASIARYSGIGELTEFYLSFDFATDSNDDALSRHSVIDCLWGQDDPAGAGNPYVGGGPGVVFPFGISVVGANTPNRKFRFDWNASIGYFVAPPDLTFGSWLSNGSLSTVELHAVGTPGGGPNGGDLWQVECRHNGILWANGTYDFEFFTGVVPSIDEFGFAHLVLCDAFFDNIKVGTTGWGSSDLFNENFEGATPLNNFDWTTGTVAVANGVAASPGCGGAAIIGTGTTPDDPPAVFAKGFRWICGQAQNDTVLKNPEINPAWKAAGFYVGVWGVTYHPDNFARDGAALVAQAVAVDADFLIMDAEFCLYNSDPTALINALAAFSGPKALTTFGAASNGYVLPIDYQKFLDAGYYIFPQAYYSATSTADGQSADYLPTLCIAHCNRAHIPLSKVNLMIDMCSSGHPDAAEQVALLSDANKRTAFSIFMTECCTLSDLDTLGDVTSPETPFSFMTPGLITDNGGSIVPGPGRPSDPGFPPDGEGPNGYNGGGNLSGGAGGTGGSNGGDLTPLGGEDGGIGVFGYWNPDTNSPSGSTPQQGGLYLIDHSDDPDFGTFITFRAGEETEWDDMIRGVGNISYQISVDARDEQSNALVFSGPDFIGPMRSYYRLRYGSIVIMAGVITNTDIPLGQDYMSVAGKTWEHFLERWQYPFDPRDEVNNRHVNDFQFPKTFQNDENTATGNDTPTGLAYQASNRDVIRILRDIFDKTMNGVSNRVLFGINNLDGLSGIKTNYQLSLGDTSYLDSIISGLAETGNGFDWWISYDKKFNWASPYRFGSPGAPSLVFTFTDTALPDDLHFNNAGPGATHVLGTGAGLASQNRLGRAYGYGPAQTQFSRFDRSYDLGDIRSKSQLILRTQKRLARDLQPQHNFPLQIDPYRITNFWSTFRKGRAVYVDVRLPHPTVVMHRIDSGQQLKSYKAKLDANGDCVVDFDLDQIYDLSINAGSPEG